MMWQHCIRIADVLIGIESACPEFNAVCRKMLLPFETVTLPPSPDLYFQVTRDHNQTHISVNDEHLWSSSDIGGILASFEVNLYQRSIALITPRYSSIHAASVAVHGGACIFAGHSGAGKSSICTQALLNDALYMSDEFSLLNEEGTITPFPRPLQWEHPRHPAFTHQQLLSSKRFSKTSFSFPTPDGKRLRSLLWLPLRVQHKPLPLKHIVLHRYDRQANGAILTPIRRGEALMELPRHLHLQQRPDEMLRILNRRIPQHTQFHRLHFSDVRHAWDAFSQMCASEAP